MKKIKFLLMLLLGVVMSVSFVSCGDDDDDDNNGQSASSSIVGTWNLTYTYNDDKAKTDISKTYTFKADGTFTYIYDDEWNISTQLGTYQYDKDSGILILVTTDSSNKKKIGTTENFKIELVANSYIIIDNEKFLKK